MKKDLLALLRKIKPVTLKSGVVRTLEEAELASVVGGLTSVRTTRRRVTITVMARAPLRTKSKLQPAESSSAADPQRAHT